jgi:hypothetical protein
MAGLVPAIHAFLERRDKDVDARDKPGHDEGKCAAFLDCNAVSSPQGTEYGSDRAAQVTIQISLHSSGLHVLTMFSASYGGRLMTTPKKT